MKGGQTAQEFEIIFRNNDVVAITATRDLLAVGAVAESIEFWFARKLDTDLNVYYIYQ